MYGGFSLIIFPYYSLIFFSIFLSLIPATILKPNSLLGRLIGNNHTRLLSSKKEKNVFLFSFKKNSVISLLLSLIKTHQQQNHHPFRRSHL